MTDPWGSMLLGGGIGLAYGVAAYLTLHLAAYRLEHRFVPVVLGGMILRMMGLLLVVGLVAYLLEPSFLPFVAALGITLLGGVGVEIWAAMSHVQGRSRNEQPS